MELPKLVETWPSFESDGNPRKLYVDGECVNHKSKIITGWCFGTWLLFFHSVGNVIIPTDFHSIIFQRGGSTTRIPLTSIKSRVLEAPDVALAIFSHASKLCQDAAVLSKELQSGTISAWKKTREALENHQWNHDLHIVHIIPFIFLL